MPAAVEAADAEAILRRCISCFTHRHLKHDRERQQAALREAAIAVPFLRPRLCGQMAELLRLGRGIARSDSSDGNKGMCALLSAVASPPAALFTGADTRHSAEAAIHAFAASVAAATRCGVSQVEEAAHAALGKLMAEARRHDHRADPPPRLPTPALVTALESEAVVARLVEVLACGFLQRKEFACDQLVALCRGSPAACQAALDSGASTAVLANLRAAGGESNASRDTASNPESKTAPGQLAMGSHRLLFGCVELMSILMCWAPDCREALASGGNGSLLPSLLPLLRLVMQAADSVEGRRLKNGLLLLLTQLSSAPSGPAALAHDGHLLRLLMGSLLATLTPHLVGPSTLGSGGALRLCRCGGVDNFEAACAVLELLLRCLTSSAECAALAVEVGVDLGMRHLMDAASWAGEGAGGGGLGEWRADEREALRLGAAKLVREVVAYSDSQLRLDRTSVSARLEAAADLVSLLDAEAVATARGEPAPLLAPVLEALRAIAADPAGGSAGAERLRSLGALAPLGRLACEQDPYMEGTLLLAAPPEARGGAVQALAAMADADLGSAEEICGLGFVPALVAALDSPMGGTGACDPLLPGSAAWLVALHASLLASLSSAAFSSAAPSPLLTDVARQLVEADAVAVVAELLTRWPPPLLWSGFALLGEWASSPRLLEQVLSSSVTVAPGGIGHTERAVSLPVLAVVLRAWAANETSTTLRSLLARGEPSGRDAVAPRAAPDTPLRLLDPAGADPAEAERPSEVLGKVYAILHNARLSDLPLPPLDPRDLPLASAALAYPSMRLGREWARLAAGLAEEGTEPLPADARRISEAVEAAGRGVDTSWAAQAEQWSAVHARSLREELDLYAECPGRTSVTRRLTPRERVRAKMPGMSGPSHAQRVKGKAVMAAMMARSGLVATDASARTDEADASTVSAGDGVGWAVAVDSAEPEAGGGESGPCTPFITSNR